MLMLPPTGLYRHDTCDTTIQRVLIWHIIKSDILGSVA